jgi:hypothetical protein
LRGTPLDDAEDLKPTDQHKELIDSVWSSDYSYDLNRIHTVVWLSI